MATDKTIQVPEDLSASKENQEVIISSLSNISTDANQVEATAEMKLQTTLLEAILNQTEVSQSILTELKILNLHQQCATGEAFSEEDVS